MRHAGGAEDFVEIEGWAQEKNDLLRRFLPFARGVPSHDAFNDLMNALPADLFSACFTAWVEGLRDGDPEIVATDGKTSRGRGRSTRTRCISSRPGPAASASCSARSRPPRRAAIKVIPLLLQCLELQGALVTIDAAGCQRDIAEAKRLP